MSDNNCMNCKFSVTDSLGYTVCRRYPPQVLAGENRSFYITVQPRVDSHGAMGWCGEWKESSDE